MKVRFLDRLLTALAGLMLFATGLIFFLWAAKGVPAAWLEALSAKEVSRVLFFGSLGLGALMVLLGFHGIYLLFRRQGKKGFVIQKTEHGQLSISIHAMENLVQKCIDKHEELTVVSNRIENTRDGVVVDLRIGLANGVSIPLVVSTLQKQIKQYITSCSGIDVKEVRVEVEAAGFKAEKSPYNVPEALLSTGMKQGAGDAQPLKAAQAAVSPPPVKAVQTPPPPEKYQPPQEKYQPPQEKYQPPQEKYQPPQEKYQPPQEKYQPPAQVPPSVMKIQPDLKGPVFPEPAMEQKEQSEEKKRPLHQRLFGHKEQQATVPIPPEMEKKQELRTEDTVTDEEPPTGEEELGEQEEEEREEH